MLTLLAHNTGIISVSTVKGVIIVRAVYQSKLKARTAQFVNVDEQSGSLTKVGSSISNRICNVIIMYSREHAGTKKQIEFSHTILGNHKNNDQYLNSYLN